LKPMLSNFCKINYLSGHFKVRSFPYSDELLSDLRKRHNATHSFFRFRDNIISMWADGSDLSEGDTIDVGIGEHELVERATKHLFFRTFIRNLPGLKPLAFYPFQTLSRQTKFDAARPHLPDHLRDVIKLQRLTEIHLRKVIENGEPVFGFVVSLKRRWLLEKTFSELIKDGFDVTGRPVVYYSTNPAEDDVLEPDGIAIGRLAGLDGDICSINTSEGIKRIPLSNLSLRRSRSEIYDILAFYTSNSDAKRIFDDIYNDGALTADAGAYYEEIGHIVRYLSRWTYKSNSGFQFSVSSSQRIKLPSVPLAQTNFIFDITPGAVSKSVTHGLVEHGPYDSSRFIPKIPRFLAVCSAYNRGKFAQFMGALQNGIATSRWYPKGLINLYRMNGINWDVCEVKDYNADNVYNSILSKIENDGYDLVFVEGQEPRLGESLADNPYWRAKSLCLSNGIPFQSILPWRTRQPKEKIDRILGPLALQVYAKLGGTPWAIESSADVDHEIIVGVGHYIERESEFQGGGQHRFVGVTTFFSAEGSFILASKCRAVPYDEYLTALLESLRSSIAQIAEEGTWRNSQTIRLVFHIFKPLRRDEVEVIDQLVKEFPQYDIRYAFVTISTSQPLVMFAESSRGELSVPLRSTNLLLSPRESLIQLKGQNEIKYSKHGFTHPSLIRIHELSTFQDIHHITQQVLDFTHISWRGFLPTFVPVTIFYANLVAENLQKLSTIPGWNPAAISVQLKRKKWFL
jgi:hypothetical protein